jgi:predicted phage terminase large subunit-like protein
MGMDIRKISDEDAENWCKTRWKARTDLIWLCQNVLPYRHVEKKVHGPIVDSLQRFAEPSDLDEMMKYDRFNRNLGKWEYKPIKEMTRLPGGRRNLILYPRGHLKTTINAQAHVIQWLLNYPDMAIQIIQSNTEKAEMIVGEVKHAFQYNPKLRELFPEYCPQRNIKDWGTKSEFTVLARAPGVSRKESSVMTGSIDKGTAGLHFDLMKFSDIVEPSNIKTALMVKSVTESFYMMENLLVSPSYWIDVEGTRYVQEDLYGQLVEQYMKQDPEDREYTILVRGCWQKDFKDQPVEFTPENLDLPNIKDEDGHEIPIWPQDNEGKVRFTWEKLKKMSARDKYIFSCQQENNPKQGIDGREVFPVIRRQDGTYERPRFISDKNYQRVGIVSTEVVVDTAETTRESSNNTAITVGSWDRYGRLYIRNIIHGKFMPSEIAVRIRAAVELYKASEVKIEETSFVRGFMPTLEREMQLGGTWIPITLIKRENTVAKKERIQNTLEPWYRDGLIIFLETIPKEAKAQLLKELKNFSHTSIEDDILDTLADFFQTKTWFGRHIDKKQVEKQVDYEAEKMLGIVHPDNPMVALDPDFALGPDVHQYYNRTGGL